ncbi:MAG: hypothetical protein K5678_09030 [Acetatifactor sp.]|nr:hypothetical protein [Lachnospiraceae bacterium]MBQ3906224.1 hypothetical protein [Lachnospiraceae bacterium]MCR4599161.1 hypothetical protein [Acetatifactor sp.]
MGLLDNLLNKAGAELSNMISSESRKTVSKLKNGAEKLTDQAVKEIKRKKQSFTFTKLPENVAELKALPQANLQDPFGVAALVILAMNNYCKDASKTIEMMNFLKGPSPMAQLEISRLKDQLTGKDYLMRSYFDGTTPENNYKPTEPYSVTVFDNAHSYDNKDQGYVTLWIKSSGADSERQVRLRKKGSTGEWFLYEEYLTMGIRVPKEQDAWA